LNISVKISQVSFPVPSILKHATFVMHLHMCYCVFGQFVDFHANNQKKELIKQDLITFLKENVTHSDNEKGTLTSELHKEYLKKSTLFKVYMCVSEITCVCVCAYDSENCISESL